MLAVAARLENPLRHQPLQAVGEDVGGDALRGIEELRVAVLAADDVADHEQRPAVAEHVERAGDRAPGAAGGGGPGAGRHGSSRSLAGVAALVQ
jgi:hypothetical protein